MAKLDTKSTQPLKVNIKQLGAQLGKVMAECDSADLLNEVEFVRLRAKDLRKGNRTKNDGRSSRRTLQERDDLHHFFAQLGDEESFKIAKAFTEFLRLANAAEQYHRVRRRRFYETHSRSPQQGSVEGFLKGVKPSMRQAVLEKLNQMEVDLVITAHPTESMRQSALRRYKHISQNLAILDQVDATRWEKELAMMSLNRNVRALWLTDIIQDQAPTPFSEALGGFSIVEEVLWDTVPRYYRRLDALALKYLSQGLSLSATPIRFSSWVGGDRDGNPNVTATVTRQVLYQGMEKAYQLILEEVDWLRKEMSFNSASQELLETIDQADKTEPYRVVLNQLRSQLEKSLVWVRGGFKDPLEKLSPPLMGKKEIMEPLELIYRSLLEIGAQDLAQGRTLDLIRRLQVFGVSLLGLDLRQSSDIHGQVVEELLRPICSEAYLSWSENKKQEILGELLKSESPIPIPHQLSELGQEVLETCRMIDDFPEECFRSYIVSMAEETSDLLEVLILFKAVGLKRTISLTPLLETPEALRNGRIILESALDISAYREFVGSSQSIMLGYSDSAKRSGRLSSAWLLHQVQIELNQVADLRKMRFEFFHGRGGSIGRGGGPIHLALLALPRGHSDGRLRVTEQGESVHGKFGLPGIAERTMELYVSGVLEAAVSKATSEKEEWYSLMEQMAERSSQSFREMVYDNDRFLAYFSEVTPIKELSLYKIGSRPARRKSDLNFESLRAIPWVYSWTQNRGLLPSWLGLEAGLGEAISQGQLSQLRKMYRHWPFFRATMSLFEMVLAKVDIPVFRQYSKVLVSRENQDLSEEVIRRYQMAVSYLSQITGHRTLLEDNPVLRRSIAVRTPYVDVLNILQAHFLRSYRQGDGDSSWVQRIIALTIGGISAGMRNTG